MGFKCSFLTLSVSLFSHFALLVGHERLVHVEERDVVAVGRDELVANGLRLFAFARVGYVRRVVKDVIDREHAHYLHDVLDTRELLGGDERPREPRIERKLRHPFADLGEAVLERCVARQALLLGHTRVCVVVDGLADECRLSDSVGLAQLADGTEHLQVSECCVDRLVRGLAHEVEREQVANAQRRQLQHHRQQIGAHDLRHRIVGELVELVLGEQAIARALHIQFGSDHK